MRYKITPSFNDGKKDAPPVFAETEDLCSIIEEELHNDEGRAFGAGFTLTIEPLGEDIRGPLEQFHKDMSV